MSLQDSHQIGDVKVMLKVGADGNGIVSIEKTGTSGIVDTYTITFDDGNKTTFDVTNGSSIASIEKTATVGNVDTYTITLTNGETSTFTVTNGTGSTASDIDYDNTTSGLSATKVQGAIDEVASMAEDASTASGTSFDNTGTELSATDTQNAITEILGKTKHGIVELWENPNPDSSFAGQTVNVTIDKDYDAYWVEYGEVSSNAYFALGSIIIEKNGKGQISLTYVTGGGKISRLYRNISLSISGSVASFVFADCTKQDLNSYGTSPSTITANAELFPRRIFGIIHND